MTQQKESADSCCQPSTGNSAKQTGLIALAAGTVAAVLASLCCAGPLLAVWLGISGAVALAGLGKYHVYFIVAAVLILAVGGVYVWKRQKACGISASRGKFWAPLLISFALFGILTLGINQVLIPYLSASSSATTTTAPTSTQLNVAVFNIEGMDCAGCVGTIHAALSKAAGVRSASVLFKEKQAKVTYDSSVTNPDRLIAVVASTHYAAKLVKQGKTR